MTIVSHNSAQKSTRMHSSLDGRALSCYVGIEELDGYALRELVSAIYVDAPDKSSGKRVQHIHIKYDGLGFIPLNDLMKEETA